MEAPVNFVISVPSPFAAGDPSTVTVTAYDGNYNVATGYSGTVHFSTSDIAATLPVTYTFTGGDNGTHTFTNEFVMRTAGAQTITATDVSDATITATRNVVVALPRPTGLIATAITTTRIDLSWTAVPGAVSYEVARTAAGVPYGTITTTGFNTYSDATALASAAYAYKVRAIDASSAASTYSDPDAATTLFFANDPLVAGSTVIQAVHLTQARTAVNLVRAVAGLGDAPFTDASPAGVAIKAVHLQELRTALSQARSSLACRRSRSPIPASRPATPSEPCTFRRSATA